MFTFHCVASPSTLVKFSSASSEYLKLVDSSAHDYNYWRNQCTGKLLNQQKKVNHWVGVSLIEIPLKLMEIPVSRKALVDLGGGSWVQILSFSCSF